LYASKAAIGSAAFDSSVAPAEATDTNTDTIIAIVVFMIFLAQRQRIATAGLAVSVQWSVAEQHDE
jgi:hypothetical protein